MTTLITAAKETSVCLDLGSPETFAVTKSLIVDWKSGLGTEVERKSP